MQLPLLALTIFLSSPPAAEGGLFDVLGVVGDVAKVAAPLLNFIPVVGPAASVAATGIGMGCDVANSILKSSKMVDARRDLVRNVHSMAIEALSNTDNDYKLLKALSDLADQGNHKHLRKIDAKFENLVNGQARLQSTAEETFRSLNSLGQKSGGINRKLSSVQDNLNQQRVLNLMSIQNIVKMQGKGKDVDDKTRQILSGVTELGSEMSDVSIVASKIDSKIDEVNEDVGALIKLANDIKDKKKKLNAGVIRQVLDASQTTQNKLSELHTMMDSGFETVKARLDSFGKDMTRSITTLDKTIDTVNADLKKTVLTLLVASIEELTKEARECYRRLLNELMDKGTLDATGIQIITNPSKYTTPVEKTRLKHLMTYLENPVKGLKSCWDSFRAVFNPATGAGLERPRNVFNMLVHLFNQEFRNSSEWISNIRRRRTAINELKTFNRVGVIFNAQISNLYQWRTAYIVAKQAIDPYESTQRGYNDSYTSVKMDVLVKQQQQLMIEFSHEGEFLTEQLDKSFQQCKVPVVMEEALNSFRMVCDEAPFYVPSLLPKICEQVGSSALPQTCSRTLALRIGTVCNFTCMDDYASSSKRLPLVCTLTDWSMDEQTVNTNLQNCAKMTSGVQEVQSLSEKITSDFDVVKSNCEIPTTPTDVDTPESRIVRATYRCTTGWHQFEDYCYKIYNNRHHGWEDAEDRCRGLQANLVSINKQEENDFIVKDLIRPAGLSSLWIGLVKSMARPFSWNDGSAMRYSRWAGGSPTVIRGLENCVRISETGRWHSVTDCANVMAYICKRQAKRR